MNLVSSTDAAVAHFKQQADRPSGKQTAASAPFCVSVSRRIDNVRSSIYVWNANRVVIVM